MTWGKFKKLVEESGVDDTMEIHEISWHRADSDGDEVMVTKVEGSYWVCIENVEGEWDLEE